MSPIRTEEGSGDNGLDAFWIAQDGGIGTSWANPVVDSGKWRPALPIVSVNSVRSDSLVVCDEGFCQRQAPAKMLRVGLYARVSTHDQQTLPLQMRAMREYASKRGWTIAIQIKEVGSGAAERELREELLAAARRREIDVVLVWRLDRWGRSLVDLVVTLKELAELGVAFVSLTEALDLTTPTGRAMAGLLSVFAAFEHEIIRERIRAGIAEARLKGKHLGRPVTVGKQASQIRKLNRAGVSKAEIARRLNIGRTSVRRILGERNRP